MKYLITVKVFSSDTYFSNHFIYIQIPDFLSQDFFQPPVMSIWSLRSMTGAKTNKPTDLSLYIYAKVDRHFEINLFEEK